MTWACGDPERTKQIRKAYREKEKKKAKFTMGDARPEVGKEERTREDATTVPRSVPRALAKEKQRPARKEGQPFRLEKADGSATGELAASTQPTNDLEGKVCSITQMRSWVRAKQVETVCMIKLQGRRTSRGPQKEGAHPRSPARSFEKQARKSRRT